MCCWQEGKTCEKECDKLRLRDYKRASKPIRSCAVCNDPIPVTRQRWQVCSDDCHRARIRARVQATAIERRTPLLCVICGKECPKRRRRYCSNACKQVVEKGLLH